MSMTEEGHWKGSNLSSGTTSLPNGPEMRRANKQPHREHQEHQEHRELPLESQLGVPDPRPAVELRMQTNERRTFARKRYAGQDGSATENWMNSRRTRHLSTPWLPSQPSSESASRSLFHPWRARGPPPPAPPPPTFNPACNPRWVLYLQPLVAGVHVDVDVDVPGQEPSPAGELQADITDADSGTVVCCHKNKLYSPKEKINIPVY